MPERPELLLRVPVEDEALLAVATESATADCMAERGFVYAFVDYDAFVDGISRRNAAESLRFPLGDATETDERVGSPPDVVDPNAAYINSLDDAARQAYGTALNGSGEHRIPIVVPGGVTLAAPGDGCRAEAVVEVYRGDLTAIQTSLALLGNVVQQLHAETLTDADVQVAQANWSACVAESGYQFESFADAREARLTGMNASDADALRDVDRTCALSSGLTEIYRATFNRRSADLYEQYREVLDTFVRGRDAAIARLGGESAPR